MYEAHWNLTSAPFDNHFDPAFYYPSDAHQAAVLKLLYAIEMRRPAAILCGDSGMGKTMLMETCIDQLPESIHPVIRVPYPAMPAEQLIRYIARQLSPDVNWDAQSGYGQSIECIERALRSNLEQGKHALVVVDEAHLLEATGALQPLRMLLNLAADQSPSESAWSLCLVGNVSLVGHVSRIPDLEDRIAVRCVLDRFSLDATMSYISHRLRAAGHSGEKPIFTDRALDAIQLATHGVPRRINRLCDMTLMIGYAQDFEQIDEPVISLAMQELSSKSLAA